MARRYRKREPQPSVPPPPARRAALGRRWSLVLAGLVGLLVLGPVIATCLDTSTGGEGAAFVTATSIRPSPMAARPVDPQAVLLALSDMPTGWTTAAPASGPPNRSLCDVPVFDVPRESEGQIAFARGQLARISHAVSVFPAGTAAGVMAKARDAVRSCQGWTITSGKENLRAQIAEMSFPALGDEVLAVRQTGRSSLAVLEGEGVYIRYGDVIVFVSNSSGGIGVTAPVDTALTERVVRLADEKYRKMSGR